MDLFVRESGPVGALPIVFLHGGRAGGWCWEPVMNRLPTYHCLAPDLPRFGASMVHGPFEIGRAAESVAELIRSRVRTGRASVVGFSLGAQVAVHLLATEQELVERAVLCGPVVNRLPYPQATRHAAGLLARNPLIRRTLMRRMSAHRMDVPAGDQLAEIVSASVGFTIPADLQTSQVPALFVSGAKEPLPVRRWAAALARRMPRGVDAVALGMRHDWPLRHPVLCSGTVDAWITGGALPREIVPC